MSCPEQDQLPTSKIRSPGDLFKDKKDPSKVKVNQKYLDGLLTHLFSESCTVSTPPKSNSQDLSFSSSSYFNTGFIVQSASKPSLSKSTDDLCPDTCAVITLAERVLFTCGMKLEFTGKTTHSKEVCEFLKIVIQALCHFSLELYKTLQFKRVVIFSGGYSVNSLSSEDLGFSMDNLNSKEKVQQKVFKLVFDRILITNPEFIKEWKKMRVIESSTLTVEPVNHSATLEQLFMALMHNVKSHSLKYQFENLQKIITLCYPEEISESWFGDLKNGKRKF